MKTLYLKKLLFLTLVLFTTTLQAKNYYISTSGSDANNGVTPATAWQTITKVNSSLTSVAAGDSILFKSGNTFYGTLVISKSGTASKPIVLGAYGSGAKPVITGFINATGWTRVGVNLWQSSAISSVNKPNMVTINNNTAVMGRYPNSGYLTFEGSVGNSSITDNQLTGTPNWTGAELVVRKNHWILSRDVITNHSGATITYTGISGYNSINGYGYFVQNSLATLDTPNEWYFNNSTRKITVYATAAPANVKVSGRDTLLYLGQSDYVTVNGIAFEGANIAGACIGSLNNQAVSNIIQNCDFNFSGRDAVYGTNNTNCFINNCTISNTLNNAIVFANRGGKSLNLTVSNNLIKNTGLKPGMGYMNVATSYNVSYSGINIAGDNSLIQYNTIDSTGYNPINYQYNYSQVKYNKINYYCLVKDDGAGIYTWTGYDGVTQYVGRKVIGNIVMNGIGAGAGTLNGIGAAQGIYLDDGTTGVLVDSNTVFNTAYGGIYIHNTRWATVTNNLVYACKVTQLLIVHDEASPNSPIRNLILQNNKFVGDSSLVPVVTIRTTRNDIDSFSLTPGAINNNYYCRPHNENLTFNTTRKVNGAVMITDYTLASWRAAHPAYEAASNISPLILPNYQVNSLLTSNRVTNGHFTSNISGYGSFNNGTNITVSLDNTSKITGAGSMKLTPARSSLSYITIYGTGTGVGAVSSSKKYILRVTTLASGHGILKAYIRKNGSPYADLSTKQVAAFGPTKEVHEFLITAPTTDAAATVAFDIQESSGVIYLDDIEFYETNATVLDNRDKISFEYNASVHNKTIALYATYIGLDKKEYIGSNTLKPYGSAVLIKSGAAIANIKPTADAGTDKVVTLPANSVIVTGTGKDSDGTISSYAWAIISGPSSGTITASTAATTAVNNLVQGVYKFELTVKDNNAAIGKDTIQVTVNAAANRAPAGNAGTDKVITLPANTTTLSGSGTDTDGTISNYAWAIISGPSSGTITASTAATTAVNNLVQGVYKFELTVKDNNAAIGKDTVQVTVNAAVNQLPVATAGIDNVITLPTNYITLTGSATDADGAITGYAWKNISGPSAAGITMHIAATTLAYNLEQGVYQFELTVTDNKGAIANDTVQVTVNAAPNQVPQANAGTDIAIALPINTASLTGSATDADGSIISYTWTKISGPSFGTIAAMAQTTTVSNLAVGVYQYELTVTDNNSAIAKDTVQVTVTAAVNQLPVANAGADSVITLPINYISLKGNATDADGTITRYSWKSISGPSTAKMTISISATTLAYNLIQGVYQFELTVTDNKDAIAKDTVQVFVNAALNSLPVVNAGTDIAIILPANTIILTGSATDTDGAVGSYSWLRIAGPSAGTIMTNTNATTSVENLLKGVYLYELTVTDNNGGIAKDSVQVTVNAAPNQLPVVNAGNDDVITLPTNFTILTGSATDADGTISSYAWLKIAGPSFGTILTNTTGTTIVDSLVEGVYQFELTVTDNNGAIGKDTVQVTLVAMPVLRPEANAGDDIVVKAPANKTVLSGRGMRTDGTIISYSWAKVSGPVSGKVAFADSSSTLLTKLVEGVYQYELTVTDNSGAIGKDTVQVKVNKTVKHPPVAKAGNNSTVILPANIITLSGNSTVTDDTIRGVAWVKISGPSSGTIVTPESVTTVVNNVEQGVYQYELTVTSTTGEVGKDTVQVTVKPRLTNQLLSVNTNNTVKNTLKVYPNPVGDIASLDITTDAKNRLSVSVTDITGRVVKYAEYVNMTGRNTVKLDMYGLRDGYYIITVRFDDGQKLSSKLVKMNGK